VLDCSILIIFLLRFKVHRDVQMCNMNQFEKLSKRKSSRNDLRCLHFIKCLKSGSIFGQKFSIRLDVTPRECAGDKVTMLYGLFLLMYTYSEVHWFALQPDYLKYNNIDCLPWKEG
jgi:hypothetical protein